MNRKVVAYLFGFYVFFTVYNTLIPFSFDYGLGDLPEQLSRVNWKFYFGSEDIALTDIVGNIILFMPFGFLLYMLLFYRGSR
ncbi:MAG: VanZ family protein, partial [Calditrichaeota bacterium]|nr:VanZ family protein [Calditrichota bacterium]